MKLHSIFSVFVAALAFAGGPLFGGIVLTGGGLALVEEGGSITPGNLAAGKIAFAKDVIFGAPAHAIAHVNDGLYGNDQSWIGETVGSFVGVNLGETPLSIGRVAFGRDNTGGYLDRVLGVYTLQYTTVPNPDAATPEESWTTLGSLTYESAGVGNFANPALRHAFTFTPVMATGFRLQVVGAINDLCIDELELYAPSVSSVALVETGGTFSGNNLAAGKTAFAKDVIPGYAEHTIPHLNDGVYGNDNCWIAETANSFAGINLGGTPVTISRVAFGRDNLGVQATRAEGTYTLQYTTVPNPDAATPDSAWVTLGSVDNPGTLPSPALRHRFSFTPVAATGFRIKTDTASFPIGIDEIELYDYDPAVVIGLDQPAGTPLVSGATSISMGNQFLNTTGAPTVFTLRNLGAGALEFGVSTLGTDAGDFILGFAGFNASVAAGGNTTFSVALRPTAVGERGATLRVLSNDPSALPFTLSLSGTGVIYTQADWRQTHFGSPENAGPGADLADPNGNGVNNLLEYALGGDPVAPAPASAVLPLVEVEAQHLKMSFNRLLDRTDIVIDAEGTNDLVTAWTTFASSYAGEPFEALVSGTTVQETGTGNVRAVVIGDPALIDSINPRRFVRLRVAPIAGSGSTGGTGSTGSTGSTGNTGSGSTGAAGSTGSSASAAGIHRYHIASTGDAAGFDAIQLGKGLLAVFPLHFQVPGAFALSPRSLRFDDQARRRAVRTSFAEECLVVGLSGRYEIRAADASATTVVASGGDRITASLGGYSITANAVTSVASPASYAAVPFGVVLLGALLVRVRRVRGPDDERDND
jgi:hypothetical protein